MIIDANEMAAEYIKSYQDKSRIYFIEKYLSTFNASVGKKTPFHCFPRQKVFLRTLAKVRNIVSIKPRQCGITTLTSAWATAQCVFAPEDAPETILCVGNKLDLANQLITKIRDFLTQVPRWYWGDDYYSPDPKSDKNFKSIFIKDSKSELELFNGCRVVARSSGENAARGISAVSILILDEAGFIENGKAVYATCAACMASNPNSKTVMVSTPNGHDELYYNTYKQALAHENNFTAVQFRWYQDPRYNKNLKWFKKGKDDEKVKWFYEPILDETGTVKYDEEHWEKMVQDGWTPRSPWYDEMCKSFNNDSMKIAQELDVSFQGSANNVVAPEFIDQQSKLNVREPLSDFKDPMNEETWFWKKPIDGHRYILGCLPTGDKVLTKDGIKKVEDVNENDLLITKEGERTKIKTFYKREVSNEKMISIKLYGDCEKYNFTWNHPIYASCNTKLKRSFKKNSDKKRYWDFNFDFVNAENLSKGDWVQMPNIYANNILTDDEILSKWESYKPKGKGNKHFDNPLLEKDFWWYCGMWLVEGSVVVDKHGYTTVMTAHNINEKEYHLKIKEFAKAKLNRDAVIVDREKYNSTEVIFGSKSIGKFLTDNFGKGARFKFIKEWIKYLPKEYKIELIKGYFQGDGCAYGKKEKVAIVSVSHQLLQDVQSILLSLGIFSSIKKHNGEYEGEICGRKCMCHDKFCLELGIYDSKKFLDLLGIKNSIKIKNRRVISCSLFSKDLSTIYFRISEIETWYYNGFVYNFETESASHTYCTNRFVTHNCDPSRGVSADRTAIEIIDMDGEDENGLPIIEQVGEYVGKKLGDDIGGMVYQYANLYNEAYVVVDCTGGQGDALILTMIQLGYKNFYYEDGNQKTYTVQNQSDKPLNFSDRLPGFHFQGNRYPVLASFAGMVRSNEFKIRSTRVINELDTWIFEGETGRMNHQEGSHDDTICSLAMALFVMRYTYNKLEESKHKDQAILNAYMMGGAINANRNKIKDDKPITPKSGLPFYNERILTKTNNGLNNQGAYLWLFSGMY